MEQPRVCRTEAQQEADRNAVAAMQRPPGRAPALPVCLPPWHTTGQPASVLRDAYGGFWGATGVDTSTMGPPRREPPACKGCCNKSVELVRKHWDATFSGKLIEAVTTLRHAAVRIVGKGACEAGAAICLPAASAPAAPVIVGFVTSASTHGCGAARPCGVGMVVWGQLQPGQSVVIANPYASTVFRDAVVEPML